MQDRVLMYVVWGLAALMVALWLVSLWPSGRDRGRDRDKDKDRGGRRDRNQYRGGGGS